MNDGDLIGKVPGWAEDLAVGFEGVYGIQKVCKGGTLRELEFEITLLALESCRRP